MSKIIFLILINIIMNKVLHYLINLVYKSMSDKKSNFD